MSGLYLRGRQAFGEGLDWREADIKATLVESGYQFSEAHTSLQQIPTVGEAKDVWERKIPNGKAMVSEEAIIFETLKGTKIDAVVLSVGKTPIALLKLEREIATNGGEIEVSLPNPAFSL